MPCYLFTFHGHATWMPDHPRGYVKRKRGVRPSDTNMAAAYRSQQRESRVFFRQSEQATLIEAVHAAAMHLEAKPHAAACEPTHMHILLDWRHGRDWQSIRTSLRSALSRSLNDAYGKRAWFSDASSRKRVQDHNHFD